MTHEYTWGDRVAADRGGEQQGGPRPASRNPAGAACVQPVMTDYTDDELSLMLDGVDCPDDDHARELYDALDQVDFLLWMIRGT